MTRTVGRKAARFGISGIVATAVHIAVATVSIEVWAIGQSFANALAFAVATLCSYLLNTWWSFAGNLNRRTAVRFVLVAGFGLIWSWLIGFVSQRFGWHYLVGIGIIVLTLPPSTFLVHLAWTYRCER